MRALLGKLEVSNACTTWLKIQMQVINKAREALQDSAATSNSVCHLYVKFPDLQ